jgi:chorismate mutase/prephenate dehydratase
MSDKLKDIRRKIDTLDDKIHDLLMERASLVSDVAAEKKKKNLQVVHPAREAVMIRRLLARHKAPLPEAAVVRIWRELVGAVSLLQSGLHVCVAVPEGREEFWDMARNYFGSVIPMRRVSEPLYGVASVREDESSFAVLPWPEDNDAKAWWSYLLEQGENPMRIVGALPYGCEEKDKSTAQSRALILSKSEFMESGEDHSFVAVSVEPSVSRGRIFDVLNEMGAQPLSIHTKVSDGAGQPSIHLVEVNVFMEEGDERLKKLEEKFEEYQARCILVGGYPVPPTYKPLKIKGLKDMAPSAPPISSKPKKTDKAA